MEGPLAGVRVLDLTAHVAGPAGTQLLGDMGAEVIKIEPPTGDSTRRDLGAPTHHGDNCFFLAYNRNKKSICLDLRTPAGKEAFYGLVQISDVVYDNFRPGVMENLGADYETLGKINPRIICFSSNGYGSGGPYRDRPAYDMIVQAETGIATVNGFPGQGPVKCGPPIVDIGAGVFGALAVACALHARAVTGRGQQVESSLMGVGMYFMTNPLVYYLMSGVVLPPFGNGQPGLVPHGIYPTRDGGYVAIGSCWPRIARAIGAEWLVDDPRFQAPRSRAQHREELDEILRRAFLRLDLADWLEILRNEDIAAGPVNGVDRVASHPQVQDQQMIVHMAHPLGGEVAVVANPIRIRGGRAPEDYTPPPLLGQHTTEVLAGMLGYSEEELRELRRQQDEHAGELAKHTTKER